ncbi:MAG: glycosyltransferase [Candidatus Omnitrophica bacterium]|nr:glycosyltransferase [Candidatus Omnitrophota bacterium]
MKISVVVPFYNEEGNIDFVLDEIAQVLQGTGYPFEIIAVDDASRDQTPLRLQAASVRIAELRVVTHARNAGQSAALWSGFEAVTGDVVVTTDGDRQNDFHDVPRMLTLLGDHGAVFGQRARRHDPVSKLVATRLAYHVRHFFLRDGVRDTACALKVLRKDALKYLIPVDGFLRFIPFLLKEAGVSFATVDVNHRSRSAGGSKYSLLKLYFIPVIADLLFMIWYRQRNVFCRRKKLLSRG